MYFSILSPKYHVMKHRDIDSLHRDIWNFFPGRSKNDRNFIYRASGKGYTVYSSTKPVEREGWDIESKEIDLAKIRVGTKLEIQTLINATLRRFKHDHDIVLDRLKKLELEKKSIPSKSELWDSTYLGWLRRSEQAWGFKVDDIFVNDMIQVPTKNHHFNAYDVRGVITVTDPESFSVTVLKGIGNRKDRGCGLLLLKRAS